MNAVFVDTGDLLALEIANDQHHQAAIRHWQAVMTALPHASWDCLALVHLARRARGHAEPQAQPLACSRDPTLRSG